MLTTETLISKKDKIAVVGLGYVGLPLAVHLSAHFAVVGFDLKPQRIEELQAGEDKTLEDIEVEGITNLTPEDVAAAREEERRYKLIGRSQVIEGRIRMTVGLERIGADQSLYGVEGKNKAVRYTSSTLGDLTVIGGASGTLPAAASIYRDIVNIARGYRFSR